MEENNLSGYTCPTCQKVFLTKEEFDDRHKKKNQSKNTK